MVDEAPWTAKASFYSTIFMSLSAVAAGSQQSIALDRYGQHPEGLRQLQELLKGGSAGSVSWLQLYVWQLPIMLLNISIVLFLAGLSILIWARAAHSPVWDDEMKVCTSISLFHDKVDRPSDCICGYSRGTCRTCQLRHRCHRAILEVGMIWWHMKESNTTVACSDRRVEGCSGICRSGSPPAAVGSAVPV